MGGRVNLHDIPERRPSPTPTLNQWQIDLASRALARNTLEYWEAYARETIGRYRTGQQEIRSPWLVGDPLASLDDEQRLLNEIEEFRHRLSGVFVRNEGRLSFRVTRDEYRMLVLAVRGYRGLPVASYPPDGTMRVFGVPIVRQG